MTTPNPTTADAERPRPARARKLEAPDFGDSPPATPPAFTWIALPEVAALPSSPATRERYREAAAAIAELRATLETADPAIAARADLVALRNLIRTPRYDAIAAAAIAVTRSIRSAETAAAATPPPVPHAWTELGRDLGLQVAPTRAAAEPLLRRRLDGRELDARDARQWAIVRLIHELGARVLADAPIHDAIRAMRWALAEAVPFSDPTGGVFGPEPASSLPPATAKRWAVNDHAPAFVVDIAGRLGLTFPPTFDTRPHIAERQAIERDYREATVGSYRQPTNEDVAKLERDLTDARDRERAAYEAWSAAYDAPRLVVLAAIDRASAAATSPLVRFALAELGRHGRERPPIALTAEDAFAVVDAAGVVFTAGKAGVS